MNSLLADAKIAVSSARLLLGAGDTRGAINRAYYAMLDSAQAALAAIDPKLLEAKTHASVIRLFGKHLVKERGFDRSLGRIFSQTEDARLSVDYDHEHVDANAAGSIVDGAEAFVKAVEEFLAGEKA